MLELIECTKKYPPPPAIFAIGAGVEGLEEMFLKRKNRQVGEKWVSDDCSYLCNGLGILTWH
jgi:hypothetical protein